MNGNLKSKTDRNGNVTVMTYDSMNRLLTTSVTTPSGSGNKAYAYSYDSMGNRHTMIANGVTTTYEYDERGRLETESAAGIVKSYTYDWTGNRKSFALTQNGQNKINTTYDYNNMNRLWKVYENAVLSSTYTV